MRPRYQLQPAPARRAGCWRSATRQWPGFQPSSLCCRLCAAADCARRAGHVRRGSHAQGSLGRGGLGAAQPPGGARAGRACSTATLSVAAKMTPSARQSCRKALSRSSRWQGMTCCAERVDGRPCTLTAEAKSLRLDASASATPSTIPLPEPIECSFGHSRTLTGSRVNCL